MASSAFSVLPLIGYALLAGLFAYLSVRLFRVLKSKIRISSSPSLPKPVSGAAAKNTFSLGRTTAWDWSRWTLPNMPRVPWAKEHDLPKVVRSVGLGNKTVKNAKNLSVELLPTIGLPPPPSSAPMFMPQPQLVDVSSPTTPALTAASTSGGNMSSFPGSPRTPSPPLHVSSNYALGHPSKTLIPHLLQTSFSRPPSPRALLTTTAPQKQHKRSRSLGGVPVRRLSGGMASALRNAVELQDMSNSSKHLRDTSREHLLIDFSSSATADDAEDISPAASDIGVLPLNPQAQSAYAGYGHETATLPTLVDVRQVVRQVPLVDIGDEETLEDASWNEDQNVDDGWKWFGPGPGVASMTSMARPKVAEPVQMQKLVDFETDNHGRLEPVSGVQSIQVHRVDTLVDFEDHRQEVLVDVSEKTAPRIEKEQQHLDLVNLEKTEAAEAQLVDLESGTYQTNDRHEEHGNDHDHDHATLYEFMNDQPVFKKAPVRSMLPAPSSTAPQDVVIRAAFSHPLDMDFVSVNAQPDPVIISKAAVDEEGLLFAQDDPENQDSQRQDDTALIEVDAQHPMLSAPSPSVSHPPSPLVIESLSSAKVESQVADPSSWSWDEVDMEDPWNKHVVIPSTTDDDDFEVVSGSDLITFEATSARPEPVDAEEYLEKSPAGSLDATLMTDEEEAAMPVLDLDGSANDYEESREEAEPKETVAAPGPAGITAEEEQEEEETPKATPTSVQMDLPAWNLDELDVVYEGHSPSQQEQILPEDEAAEEYPDPELLPLPVETAPTSDSHLLPPVTLASPTEILVQQGPQDIEPSAENLMEAFSTAERDTKPARGAPSQTPTPPASPPPISTSHLRVFKSTNSSRATSPISPRLTVNLPVVPSFSLSAAQDNKENETPTALSPSSRPAWSIRAQDSPALGLPSPTVVVGASPRSKRRVLADMNADMNVEAEVEEKLEAPKEVNSEEDSEKKTDDIEVKMTKKLAEAPPALEPQVHAPQIKLSTSVPGAFPDPARPIAVSSPSSTEAESSSVATVVATAADAPAPTRRQRALSVFTIPSVRSIVRSPLDVALAMQLRPGLGAGADPAWMVRFLMSMYGWLAIVIAGGGDF